MLYLINAVPYQLVKSAGRLLLRKAEFQLGLFGGEPEPVKLTPKGRRREKERGEQLTLFDMPEPVVKPKRSTGDRKRAPKGGGYYRNQETGEVKFFQGGKFIPAGFDTAPVQNETATPGGLAVIQDEPEQAIAPTEPEPEPERAIAPTEPEPEPERAIAPIDALTQTKEAQEVQRAIAPAPTPADTTYVISEASPKRLGELAAEAGLPVKPDEDPEALRQRLGQWVLEGDETGAENAVTETIQAAPEPEPTPEPTPEQSPKPAEPTLEADIDYKTVSGQKTRLKINEQVRALLAQGKDPSEYTEAEKTLLAKYSGKGGLGNETESINEYYTRPDVAQFCVDQLYRHGFEGGSVLEPSCGHGVFLGALNQEGVLPVGVEMDSTSSACAAALNPHAVVSQGTQFERFLLDNPDTQFEGIVGNVPFGSRMISSDFQASQYKLDKWKDAADLFVHESLMRLQPGGVMSIIVPRGVVEGAKHQTLRQELVKQGRVVGAYRLPNTAFKHAGSPVITDVLVVQRHPDDILNAINAGDEAAIAATADHNFVGGGYFKENPDNILGTEKQRKRGDRMETTVEGTVEDALQKADGMELTPAVDYSGIKVKAPTPKVGDTKYINGSLYRLEGNPPRWHLVEQEEAEPELGDPSVYGTGSIAEAEAILADPGKRVQIHPDQLEAYLALGGNLSRAELQALRDAIAAVKQASNPQEAEKIAHAMLLAGYIKQLQDSSEPDTMVLQQALGMLQHYRDVHGNPATDRKLSAIASQNPALFALQGAFDETGKISDYFADPDKVLEQLDRNSQGTPRAAMEEAFRAAGGEPVRIDEILQVYGGELSGEDLAAMLLSDPEVGYINGTFQPKTRLMRGNGFELMDSLLSEAGALPEGSPYQRKLLEQVGQVRSLLEPRALEDMTTPFWAVGSWIPLAAFNGFMEDRGYSAVRMGSDGEYEFTDRGWKGQLEADVLTWMNRGRISHGANTKEAKDAVIAFESDFRDWLAGSDYRIEVEEAYNLAFNGDLPQEYSGDPLDIEGIEQYDGDEERGIRKKRLHHYQTSTIRQMAEQGRGIISLGVGLGKTATSIALSQYLRSLGRAKKPAFVVPKSVLANWVREVGFWGKDLNVMILGQTQQFWQDGSPAWEVPGYTFKLKGGVPVKDADGNYVLFRGGDKSDPVAMSERDVQKRGNLAFKDDDAATKQRKLQQLSQNSYDLVLMSEPVFQDIPLDPEREYGYLDAIAGKHINPDTKAAKDKSYKLQEQIETRKRKLAERRGDKSDSSLITWEDLGIDCLIHDEAHHLKNLFSTGSRTGDVAFLSTAESNRALDFYYKSQYTREQNNNQNVYLLTATPTTNNPLEAFNMLQHVCPEEFEQRGIQNVDDFLQMFGKIQEITVPGVDLEMTSKNGLVGFKNLKDLRKLFTKYCRMQSAKDVGLPIPEEKNHDVVVDMTSTQQQVYGDLKQRAADLAKKGPSSGGDEDHIFSVISDMEKAAIDLDYYNSSHSSFADGIEVPEGERSPKIEASVQRVMGSRVANGGKQIVFCDAIQLHGELKAQLVQAGYPEDEIMIVNASTAKKSSDRQKISQAYNDGRITLVIGNTATMGEGMNFQIGTTDIHHLTTPWTPAAIEQRNGRGVRQGNDLDEVNIHYYHAAKSFDLYRKGVIERKRGWIDELWKGTEDEATNQNTGAFSMDEISIMMSDDPDAARKQLESNKELQLQKFQEKQRSQSLRQFGQLQTMKQAIARMSDEVKASQRGKELIDKYERAKGNLARNEHFPYKNLLDGNEPAYVGTDGTVLAPGHHVEKQDGSVWRVTGVNNQTGKITALPVFGTEYRPFDFDATKPEEFEFKRVNARSYGVKPVDFSGEARDRKMVDAVSRFEHLRKLSPEQVDSNRQAFVDKIRGGDLGSYDYIPHINPATGEVDVKYGRELPEGAQILFPHDGEAVEKVIQSWAARQVEGRSRDDYYYRNALEGLTGQSMGYSSEYRKTVDQKLETYKAQHRAMLEAQRGPKEGDRKTENGSTYELRGGRWHLVDASAAPAAPEPSAPVAPVVPNRIPLTTAEYEQAGAKKKPTTHDRVRVTDPETGEVYQVDRKTIDGKVYKISRERSGAYWVLDESATPAVSVAPEPSAPAPAPSGFPDPIGAIHDAILRIEGDDAPDRGMERNDAGWSAFTRKFGSSLAAQIQRGEELSPNQLKAALTMLASKHRRQAGALPTLEELNATLPDAGSTSRPSSDRGIRHIGDAIAVSFPYDKADVARVKDIEGARWNKVKKYWEVPFQKLEEVQRAFPNLPIDESLFSEERVFDEPPKPMGGAGLIRADGNRITVSFPYDKSMVARVKGIKAAGRQAGKWNGREWEFPNNETVMDKLRAEFPEFDLAKSAQRTYTLNGLAYQFGLLPMGGIGLIKVKRENYAI